MAEKTKTNLLDLPISLLLGIGFCALLGYTIALRIVQWNPDLAQSFRSVIILLLSSSYLYSIFGIVVGVGLWALLFLISRLGNKPWRGRTFVRAWIPFFLSGATLMSVYFMATRQHLRSGKWDNLLLITWYLTTVFLCVLLYHATKLHPQAGHRKLTLTLPKFFALFFIIVFLVTGLVWTTSRQATSSRDYGDKAEIKTALDGVNWDTKVAIIGWDGGEWSVIERLLAEGTMPNLQCLIDGGVHARLRSLPSTKSPLVWTSIATGKVPAKHGINDFGSFQFPGMVNNFSTYPDGLGYYRLISRLLPSADLPVTSTTRKTAALWEILSQAKHTTGMIGWWATWPAEPVNGFMISDRFTYTLFNPRATARTVKKGQTYPVELLDEVSQFIRTPDSITDAEYQRFLPNVPKAATQPANWNQDEYQDWNPMYQFRLAYSAAESYRSAGLYLYQKYHPSYLGVYFQGTDMVSHFFWQYYRPDEFISVPDSDAARYGNVIPEFYRYMDQILGEFLKILDPGTDVLVVSDHGFGYDLNPRIAYRTGEHRLEGVLIANGPHFRQGLNLEEISVLDILPTLLYLYNLPEGADMDGRVISEALDSTFVADHPLTRIKSYDTGPRNSSITRSAADLQVKDQIKALGYTN